MLIQLVTHHPEALGPIVQNTPKWVWGLLAFLLALGISQLRDRTASLARVSILPAAMTALSIWGMLAAFGTSPLLAQALGVWIVCAGLVYAAVSTLQTKATYDPATRTYALPGSVVPLVLVLGIFLVKYFVGVELAMAPALTRDTQYALTVAAIYGALTGMFVGRASLLWRLSLRAGTSMVAA
jgi:predicted neutral ceramidase superfamily lipid hydrolase